MTPAGRNGSAAAARAAPQADVAITGMACLFPGAPDLATYWQNIVDKVDATSDPPEDWEAELYYDPDSTENDRVYCKRGGYLGDLARFDPIRYGVMPTSLDGGEPDQFLALRIAAEALADAGHPEKRIDRERVEVIIGRGTYINRGFSTVLQHGVVVDQVLRILARLHPEHDEDELRELKRELKASLPPFNAEMAPALVPNVMSGRIANRLDFMGPNYTIDAACASSLIAVERGVQDLLAGRCDLALVGGVHASTPAPIHMIFCQLNALSRVGRLRPFGAEADGTLLGEGLGFVALRRRADAERDGDRIYAVIKGIGTASDGRALGLLAPRLEGEVLALRRAYEACGVDLDSVDLIEAHGTGTPVGDLTEVQALRRVFGDRVPSAPPRCALGSVKSMISHLLPAAAMAGLIKTALALHHKVLPPTLCDAPDPALELDATPFYLNTETRPWIHGAARPRRAGVNAFGFGGINAHAVLEEHTHAHEDPTLHRVWDAEALVVQAESKNALAAAVDRVARFAAEHPDTPLRDLAFTLNRRLRPGTWRLGIVAADMEELRRKLERAAERLADPSCERIRDLGGSYFSARQLATEGKVAFLFPGEGAQYVGMLADVCMHFPEARRWFDLVDGAFADGDRDLLPSQVVFPAPHPAGGSDEGRLWRMDIGPEAIFAANQAMHAVMTGLGIRPDAIAGHSTGEYSALVASGAQRIGDDAAVTASIAALNAVYRQALADGGIPQRGMLAVAATDRDAVVGLIDACGGELHLAMDNCPHQLVLCGDEPALKEAARRLGAAGAICERLPFDRAYHTPLFDPFCDRLEAWFAGVEVQAPQVPLYSCATAAPFPNEPEGIRALASRQWARRVRFRDTIEALYDDGVRLFVEVGPRNTLTAFVDDTLRGRPYVAVASNVGHRSGIAQLCHAVALLASHGTPMRLETLYTRRGARDLAPERDDLADLGSGATPPAAAPGMRLATGLQPLRLDASLRRREASGPSAAKPPVRAGLSAAPESSSPAAAPSAGIEPPAAVTPPAAVAPTPVAPPVAVAPPAGAPLQVGWPSGAGPARAGSRRDAVTGAYLATMESFLALQRETMHALLVRDRTTPGAAARAATTAAQRTHPSPLADPGPGAGAAVTGSTGPARQPFLGVRAELTPDGRARADLRLTPEEHPFLADHTLGRAVSASDPGLTGLPVVPLTFSMELLAEIAATLAPDLILVGMEEVRAHRWLALDDGAIGVRLEAGLAERDGVRRVEIDARLFEIEDDGASIRGTPAVEGRMLFAPSYPAPPPPEAGATMQRSSRWTPEALYRDLMFHGPSLQGVASMDRYGDGGSTATLVGLDAAGLLRSDSAPAFLADPVALDAAGQVVGFWAAERFTSGFHVFPFRLERLELYAPALPAGEAATCLARTAAVGDGQLRSDIELVGGDGRVRARLQGWWDRRFALPDPLYRLRLAPAETSASRSWQAPLAALGAHDGISCRLLDGLPTELLGAHGRIWQRVLAGLALGRAERRAWQRLGGGERRRNDWLIGRVAAKDAVRELAEARHGVRPPPADVEIESDSAGRPMVGGAWLEATGLSPVVSISHSGGAAAALAVDLPGRFGVGIDIERIVDVRPEFADAAFTQEERAVMAALPAPAGAPWPLRCWCAKEACAKALGHGLTETLRDLTVTAVDPATGGVTVSVAGALAAAFPELASIPLLARTGTADGMAFACVLVRFTNQEERR